MPAIDRRPPGPSVCTSTHHIRTPDQPATRAREQYTPGRSAPSALPRAAPSARCAWRPVLFELGARPHAPRALYRAYLSQSDVFVGMYWQSYGWVAPGDAISGLEDEYDLADQRPKLIYVKAPAPEREVRMAALWIASVHDGASYKRFESPEELEGLLAEDLALLLTERFVAGGRRLAAHVEPEGPVAARTRLPAPATSLVGRERERAQLRAVAARSRRPTRHVVGSGGVGKTRLALAAASEVRRQFEDDVCLVPLATITDPALVASSIVHALGRTPGPWSSTARVAGGSARRQTPVVGAGQLRASDGRGARRGSAARSGPALEGAGY